MKKILTIFTICLSLIATSCMNIFDKDELKQRNTITMYSNYPNGASDESVTQTFELGVTQDLIAKPFSFLGYSLVGWSRSKDASRYEYLDGQPMNIREDLVLYGFWSNINQDIFVDGSVPTSGNGSEAAPFKTLKEAITLINGKGSELTNLPWTIQIIGNLTCNETIDGLNASVLTIKGKTGSSTDSLTGEGTGKGSVLNLSKVTVKLQGITIKNGSGTLGNDNVLRGGGVYVNSNAELILCSDCKISNNTAMLGAGVYNSGKLTMETGSIITSNTASGSAGISGGFGGGIYTDITDITHLKTSGGTVTGNTAELGGGIYSTSITNLRNSSWKDYVSSNNANVTGFEDFYP